MARSPADATRFTATGPYAASSSSFTPNASNIPNPNGARGTQIQFGAPPSANETPQQKIARLRAAADAAKRSTETRFDRTVRIGRLVADKAHRYTAMGLIGATVLTAMVATAGISDMILHNRKRRNEWLAQKRAEESLEVERARKDMQAGAATEDQVLLVRRVAATAEAEEARKNRPGLIKRSTGWLFGGLSKEETKGGRLGAESLPRVEEVMGEREDRGVLRAVEEKVEERRRTGEKVEEVLQPMGGPLDREAQRTVNAAVDAGKSWTSWLTGR